MSITALMRRLLPRQMAPRAAITLAMLHFTSLGWPSDRFIPQFADASPKAALSFCHNGGSLEKDYILEANGAGTALFDYDNDGDLDIYLVNGSWLELPPGREQPIDKLFRNDGNWKFTDVTREAGLGGPAWGCGCGVADIDNDGDLDLYVTNWGQNQLYLNNGDGTFTEAAKRAGVDEPMWGGGCAFGDYDLDGYVDLYVANYLDFDPKVIPKRGDRGGVLLDGRIPVHCGPGGLTAVPDTLYHNNGDGTFTDVSERSGIRKVRPAYGLGVIFIHVRLDRLPDIYVANDRLPNFLFHNNSHGTFEEIAPEVGVSHSGSGVVQYGMGVDAGDLTGDNLEDIIVCNYNQDYNTLYQNDGDGYFSDISREANLYFTTFDGVSWGVVLFDADYDGDLDIFFSNGDVWPQRDQTNAKKGYRQTNQLFLNDGTGVFEDVSEKAGDVFKVKLSSRGCACGDLDGDGDQDIVVNNLDEPPTVYENLGGSGNHWLGVRLVGAKCNRDAIGSWVTIKTAESEISRYLRSGRGFASHSEMTLRFGLGKATAVEKVTVQWPDGHAESFCADTVDRVLTLTQGDGKGVTSDE